MIKGNTMSDWAAESRSRGINLNDYLTDKEEDLKRIERARLPHFDLFLCDAEKFRRDNNQLNIFLAQNQREGWQFCVRAVPTEEGYTRGYTRRPKIGLRGFEDSKRFLGEVIRRNEKGLWKVAITTMGYHPYGGVIRNGEIYTHAEIGRNLITLTSGEESPLVMLEINKLASPGERIKLREVRNRDAELCLLDALKIVGERRGYFEFVTCLRNGKKETYFLDYKTAESYTRNL